MAFDKETTAQDIADMERYGFHTFNRRFRRGNYERTTNLIGRGYVLSDGRIAASEVAAFGMNQIRQQRGTRRKRK